MKNKRILLTVLAIALVLGMTVVGCPVEDGGTSPIPLGYGDIPISGGGTFTLTDIPSQYNGKYAFLFSDDNWVVIGAQSISSATNPEANHTLPEISNGSVVLTMWKMMPNGSISGYTGNDTFAEVYVYIYESNTTNSPVIMSNQLSSITFNNGNATKSFGDGTFDYNTPIPSSGTLTITNIPSQYNGYNASFIALISNGSNYTLIQGGQSLSTMEGLTDAKIASGTLTLTLWMNTSSSVPSFGTHTGYTGYTGSDKNVMGSVFIYPNSGTASPVSRSFSISFTSGNGGSIVWSAGTDISITIP